MIRLFFLILFSALTLACSTTYKLNVDKNVPPLPEEEIVTTFYKGQKILGLADTLGTLEVKTANTSKCDPEAIYDKALDIVKSSGGNGFYITSIDLELNSSYIPCTSFSGKLLKVDYDYYDILLTEDELKEKWSNRMDPIEGIYEGKDPNEFTLRLAIDKQKNGTYRLIYLSGVDGYLEPIWKEGQLKAIFKNSASKQLFKIDWINSNRTLNQDFMVSVGPAVMTFVNSDADYSEIFLKIYPTENDLTLGSGTGFAIAENGYIATNNHVIENADRIFVRGLNSDFNNEYEAKVVARDENNDLAIIQVINGDSLALDAPKYSISSKSNTLVGEDIFTLGYPLRSTMGDELKITNGIISSKTGYNGDITSYQVSAPIQPGNSGGPLFDRYGNVIGIINAVHKDAENVTYAVKSTYLTNLFDVLPSGVSVPNEESSEEIGIAAKVSQVRNYIYIITTK